MYAAEVMLDGPNGLWLLDDVVDRANRAGDLTANGSPPTTTSLIANTSSLARSLDGSSQYWTAADGTYTDLGDTFSLSAWISPTNTSSQRRLFDKGTNAFALVINTGGAIQLQRSGVAVIVTSTTTVTAGSTAHVCATKTGSTVKLYINGVDVTGTVTNATCTDTSTNLHLFRQATSSAQHFLGVVDAPAIFPIALSAARVLAHYNAGAGRFGLASSDGLSLSAASSDSLGSLSAATPDSLSLGAA